MSHDVDMFQSGPYIEVPDEADMRFEHDVIISNQRMEIDRLKRDLLLAGWPRGGPWRIAGESDDGSTVDVKDDRHCVVIGLPKGKAELLCAEHNGALAAQGQIAALRAAIEAAGTDLIGFESYFERLGSMGTVASIRATLKKIDAALAEHEQREAP